MAVGWFSWATFLDLGPPGEAATSEKRVPPRNMQGTITGRGVGNGERDSYDGSVIRICPRIRAF